MDEILTGGGIVEISGALKTGGGGKFIFFNAPGRGGGKDIYLLEQTIWMRCPYH